MRFQHYLDQVRDWPQCGRHILAQFDTDSIYEVISIAARKGDTEVLFPDGEWISVFR